MTPPKVDPTSAVTSSANGGLAPATPQAEEKIGSVHTKAKADKAEEAGKTSTADAMGKLNEAQKAEDKTTPPPAPVHDTVYTPNDTVLVRTSATMKETPTTTKEFPDYLQKLINLIRFW